MLLEGHLTTSAPPKSRGTAESAGSQSGDVSRLRDDHDEAGLTAETWGKDSGTYADATAFRVRPGFVRKHFLNGGDPEGGPVRRHCDREDQRTIFNKGTRGATDLFWIWHRKSEG